VSLKEIISGFKIFEGLSSDELDKIIPICIEEKFNEDEVIIEEDSKGSDIYIILEGRVNVEIKITSSQPSGSSSRRLTTLRDGEVFGEISFLEGGRRSACTIALDKVSVLKIDGEKLYKLFDLDNHLGFLIMRNISSILSQRLCDINFRWRDNI
jgi:CRP/FNR family transcriptional regulator